MPSSDPFPRQKQTHYPVEHQEEGGEQAANDQSCFPWNLSSSACKAVDSVYPDLSTSFPAPKWERPRKTRVQDSESTCSRISKSCIHQTGWSWTWFARQQPSSMYSTLQRPNAESSRRRRNKRERGGRQETKIAATCAPKSSLAEQKVPACQSFRVRHPAHYRR